MKCKCYVTCRGENSKKFRRENAFIGIQKDTPASIVLQGTTFLRNIRKQLIEGNDRCWAILGRSIIEHASLKEFKELPEDSEPWKTMVRQLLNLTNDLYPT